MHRIFDAHTHSFPDAVAQRAIPMMAKAADIPFFHDGTIAGLEAYERAGGADGFLMLPIATRAGQAASINAWVRTQADILNEKGMQAVPFGSVHPDDNVEAVLDSLLAAGIKGIKLHPEYQAFFADEPRMLPIYKSAADRGLIISMHAGEDLGFNPPVHGSPEHLARMLDAVPQGRFILAHMGGYKQWQSALELIAGRENVWLDTSFAAQCMGSEMFIRMVSKHGLSRVLLGTDAPWADFNAALAAVTGSGLSDADIQMILWDNAAALLALD